MENRSPIIKFLVGRAFLQNKDALYVVVGCLFENLSIEFNELNYMCSRRNFDLFTIEFCHITLIIHGPNIFRYNRNCSLNFCMNATLLREALSGGGGVPIPLFPRKKWPCSPKSKSWFSMFPKIACVPLIFRPLFPCFPEKIALVPLFPKTPGRAS